MDSLRACYRTKMRFTTGGIPYEVKWYWCPPGAKPFPSYHRFASLQWEKDEEVPLLDVGQIGEVPGQPRPYFKGPTPPGVTGQFHCGPEAWFRGPPADAPALKRRIDGVALCCLEGFQGGPNVGGGVYVASGNTPPGSVLLGIYKPSKIAEPVLLWSNPSKWVGVSLYAEAGLNGSPVAMADFKACRVLVNMAIVGIRQNFVLIASPTLHLFVNDPDLAYEMAVADFQEPGSTWYAPQAVAWTTLANLLSQQAYSLSRQPDPDFVGAVGAADSLVKGWFAVWNGNVLGGQYFDVPCDMGAGGPGPAILSLFPEFRTRSE